MSFRLGQTTDGKFKISNISGPDLGINTPVPSFESFSSVLFVVPWKFNTVRVSPDGLVLEQGSPSSSPVSVAGDLTITLVDGGSLDVLRQAVKAAVTPSNKNYWVKLGGPIITVTNQATPQNVLVFNEEPTKQQKPYKKRTRK